LALAEVLSSFAEIAAAEQCIRGQKARLSWEKFIRLVARFFPRQSGRYTPCHVTASTPKPEGGTPVR
jgi:hypothetical protein